MLHDINVYSRLWHRASEPSRRRVDAAQSRINPWLLWRPERPELPQQLTVAELAECRCPDLCNRDHENE